MERKIGSLFTGIGGLELAMIYTVTSVAPYGNEIEWMTGFPKGWVTDADDVSRTAQLAALGNACTPQQASEAFYHGLLQMTRERTSR